MGLHLNPLNNKYLPISISTSFICLCVSVLAALPAANAPGHVPVRCAPDPHHRGEASPADAHGLRLRGRHHAPAPRLPAAFLRLPVSASLIINKMNPSFCQSLLKFL